MTFNKRKRFFSITFFIFLSPKYPFDLLYIWKIKKYKKIVTKRRIFPLYIYGGELNMKRIRFANSFLKSKDTYHLAKEYYYYISAHHKLCAYRKWKILKGITEDILVWHRISNGTEPITAKDYREFLCFYTSLEIKNRDVIFIPSKRANNYLTDYWLKVAVTIANKKRYE